MATEEINVFLKEHDIDKNTLSLDIIKLCDTGDKELKKLECMKINHLQTACLHNRIDVVKYLVEINKLDLEMFGEEALITSAKYDHLSIVKYLVENTDYTYTQKLDILNRAVENDLLSIVKYVFEKDLNVKTI